MAHCRGPEAPVLVIPTQPNSHSGGKKSKQARCPEERRRGLDGHLRLYNLIRGRDQPSKLKGTHPIQVPTQPGRAHALAAAAQRNKAACSVLHLAIGLDDVAARLQDEGERVIRDEKEVTKAFVRVRHIQVSHLLIKSPTNGSICHHRVGGRRVRLPVIRFVRLPSLQPSQALLEVMRLLVRLALDWHAQSSIVVCDVASQRVKVTGDEVRQKVAAARLVQTVV
mmetsp:Transcript_12479/g.25051  ORF Transcript_12479/g.25051 Transcript_12479/m.25051 type:complete len:224 (-) Transcript_12479:234-905(-)